MVGLLLLCVAEAGAARDVANGDRFRDWTVSCSASGPGRTECALSQVLVGSGDGGLIAEISLVPQRPDGAEEAEGGSGPLVLVMRVPTNVVLWRTPQYRLSAEETASMAWQSCTTQYCTATSVLDPDAARALRAGRSMRLGYRRTDAAEPVVFDVSLMGVTAGLRAIGAPAQQDEN